MAAPRRDDDIVVFHRGATLGYFIFLRKRA